MLILFICITAEPVLFGPNTSATLEEKHKFKYFPKN